MFEDQSSDEELAVGSVLATALQRGAHGVKRQKEAVFLLFLREFEEFHGFPNYF